jgi:hypothetical protein
MVAFEIALSSCEVSANVSRHTVSEITSRRCEPVPKVWSRDLTPPQHASPDGCAQEEEEMRRLVLAATIALSFVFSLGQSTALAASTASQTIDVNGNLSFSSILGGSISGPAALSGGISSSQLGILRGSANFPLRDEKLSVAPSTFIAATTDRISVGWSRFIGCDPYLGCTYENGVSVFERTSGTGPVEIRLGTLKGNGTLSFATNPTCVATCPPPGAYWYAPSGFWQLQGAVLGSQDAGNLYMYGQAPTIH